MKKLIAMILACTFAVATLASCGASKSQSQENSSEATSQATTQANLTVFWWGNQTRNERTQEILDMYAAENPGVTFDGQFADGSDYWTRLATLSAGRTMPDVIQMDYGFIGQYARNDSLVDLTPYIEDGTIDMSNVSDTVLQTGIVDGKIYGICNGVNAPSLLYNKTLLDDAGITIKDNMTLDEFMDVCREVYEKTGYKTSLTYGSDTSADYLPYLLRAYGKSLYGENQLAVESADDFNEFFELFETGIKEGWHVDPSVYVERQKASVEQDCLVYGSSPETLSWCAFYHSNQIAAMQNAAAEGTEIGITTWPSKDVAISNYLKPSQFFSISVDSKNPDVAASLINYITNSVECNEVLLGERGVPISSVVSNTISSQLEEPVQKAVEFINDVVTPNSTTINPPAPASANQIKDLIAQLVEKVLYGQITAKDASAQLFEQGNVIMAAQ